MLRGVAVLLLNLVLLGVAHVSANVWAVRHETITFYDPTRDNRAVTVEIVVRRDKEMQADAQMITLPVAHGNTVRFTEYSFLATVFAARGYMVVSIQHDLESDPPLATKVGEPYVGRLPVYQRGIANIRFAIGELRAVQPNADYDHLTMVGHSNGGDISKYFAKIYPDQVRKVVTLDNLRVPFMTDGRVKILSFRSRDPVFKADSGVVPDDEMCEKAGIAVVRTDYRHTDMSDRGPKAAKAAILEVLGKYLDDDGNHPSFRARMPEGRGSGLIADLPRSPN
ncbi:alpha/beta hydrolase [Bradyrhizobium sp. Arg237L]|uniref:alpha/beta hydrolase n=1 Tax=Bradyrhizobium sp. Arg237L TaxID=3003352 RepID=UPI00249DE87A|nr:alpha/beta hydrolase [Bradyrhizobium sp. Arg237L]MDI4234074.1 alpha/beta hydrolase [Bradyrhizobium sp. Arg237L]